MEVRPCTDCDLELLRTRWPTPDDVAGAHYDEQQGGGATFLVGWVAGEPWGWGLIQWGGWRDDAETSELLVKRL